MRARNIVDLNNLWRWSDSLVSHRRGEKDPILGRGVACLKLNVRNCWDVVFAFMRRKKSKKGAFTNSEDPDETPHYAASHLGLCYLSFLIMVDNIKSYMFLDLFHFINGC